MSISQLMKKYDMPKTSVWHHIHRVQLSKKNKKAIASGQGGSRDRRIAREKEAEKLAHTILCSEHRELAIMAAMLYWGEGHKKTLIFTNTDKKMLKLYLLFLRKVLGVHSDQISILVRSSDPINPKSVLLYWSRELQVPLGNFKNNHDNIQNKTKTEYGICRIMVSKSNYYHKVIVSLINQITNRLL